MPSRLAASTSPYLRQHADNPVDWHEWGEDAFTEARERDVPIFLSVGYSSCHWCHVMAHESVGKGFRTAECTARRKSSFVQNVWFVHRMCVASGRSSTPTLVSSPSRSPRSPHGR